MKNIRLQSLILITVIMLTFSLSACSVDAILTPSDNDNQTPDTSDTDTTPNNGQPQPNDNQDDDQAASPSNDNDEQNNVFTASNRTANTKVRPDLDINKIGFVNDYTTDSLKETILNLFLPSTESFFFMNENGERVYEKQWLDSIAKEYGFKIKFEIKSERALLSAQSIAQKAGKALDLVSAGVNELALAASICKDFTELVKADSFTDNNGINRQIAQLTDNMFVAPTACTAVLWYNKDLIGDQLDPLTAFKEDTWTMEAFEKLIPNNGNYLYETTSWLIWGAAGGKSPIDMNERRLTSQLTAAEVTSAFERLIKINEKPNTAVTTLLDNYNSLSFAQGNVIFSYRTLPSAPKDAKVSWAPIPRADENGQYIAGFSGRAFALPKYATAEHNAKAALTFACIWAVRTAESNTDYLRFTVKITAEDFADYFKFAAANAIYYGADDQIYEIINTDSKLSQSLYNKEYVFEEELALAAQLIEEHINKVNNAI